ncbi:unnamed protein product, partial [Mesorhabditis belari]|uniref:BTB domain-containing protein n=1 Tax=Mesorhabditis belari TaxID=2138241 RepID=A0AAF3EG37_9BILA
MGNDDDPSSILPACSGMNNQSTTSSSSSNQSHYIHKSKHHDRYLLNELAALRLDEQLCDVVLLAGHTRIPAHRVVLSACSLYFRAMFMSDLKESRLSEIRMVDIEGRTLQQLINFCYSGEIKITETSVQSLLPAACLLQMSEIQDACCEFLEKNLDPTNCLGIRAFADTHSCRELVRMADLYTQKNFQEVTASDEFLQLLLDQLLSLISSDELNVGSEEQVYEAAIRWIRYDLPNRRQNLSKVRLFEEIKYTT